MRVAFFSDIHGNTLGPRAVLATLDSLGGADIVYAAGDLLGGGSGTDEVIDLLLENRVRLLRGNGEEYVVDLETALRREAHEWRRRYLGDIAS